MTLFKSPFKNSVLSDRENIALNASSLMAVPPPSPEVCPLEGLAGVNLHEANLTQWASHVQDVASGMRNPPWAASNCPWEDMVGILHRLEKLTNIGFCHHCYGLGSKCRCQRAAPQASQPLWTAPAPSYSYAAMASIMATTASTSMGGVPTIADLHHGYTALPCWMDTSPTLQTTSLLVHAGVGRGKALQAMQASARPPSPAVPGLHQVQPQSAIQQQAASVGHKVTQAIHTSSRCSRLRCLCQLLG